MNTIDFTPLYRNSIGFDRFARLLDSTLRTEQQSAGYPPYNIEVVDDSNYTITLAVAGFAEDEIDIEIEQGVLTISGRKEKTDTTKDFLYQGIANRAFERKFNLADHVEVTGAELVNGLLVVNLLKEIPEAMKPRKIAIGKTSAPKSNVLDHSAESRKAS